MLGENIGHEQNGKGDEFARPVYIFKKYDRESFFGLPTSTKNKRGTWYQAIDFNDKNETILLAQGKTFDYRRLDKRIGEVHKSKQREIQRAYVKLHINVHRAVSGADVGSPKDLVR